MRCQCDIDLTLVVGTGTLSAKILSGLYLKNCSVWDVDTW